MDSLPDTAIDLTHEFRARPRRFHTLGGLMKDIREAAKRERDYYARPRVKCAVCGKHYLTRDKKGFACSKACRQRLEGQASPRGKRGAAGSVGIVAVTFHSIDLNPYSARPKRGP